MGGLSDVNGKLNGKQILCVGAERFYISLILWKRLRLILMSYGIKCRSEQRHRNMEGKHA